jgi:hypothetical protein
MRVLARPCLMACTPVNSMAHDDRSLDVSTHETVYIDMQMSRLADITERIEKAEKRLTDLESKMMLRRRVLESGWSAPTNTWMTSITFISPRKELCEQ